ncbi:glycosyltransferase family A protein [uncultured Pseudodesulfovibrio sp.]|uniref:glycosyltransferase family 2 protein n=1 Tax=uncultured Pseudodesulfovibrio sp. TaxID=2035858 RepID=UPI0029C8CD1D|nr:glycosyltransferase family A protein [uncultured Pseudodesulfovibrio sp.]
MPILSVVIPNHDYGRFSNRLFQSLAAQSMGLDDVEILFIDDASSDDSVARAEQWAGRLNCERFVIERLERVGRPGPVRNHGLSMARGRYLFSLDPDDALRPDFMARCVDTLERNPKIAGVYPDYFEHTTTACREIRLPDFNQGRLRVENTLPPTAMYRREVWEAGVRYRANTDYEDWDFWVQCVAAGARFLHIPEPLYDYNFHDRNFSYRARLNDGPAKAAIVRNNPGFFHPEVAQWAEDLHRGRLHSQPFIRGYIPSPSDIRALFNAIEETVQNASGF